MRYSSVAFIFATLAIFGAIVKTNAFCQIQCPNITDEVCIAIDGKLSTVGECEYNNIKTCLQNKADVKYFGKGVCPQTDRDHCETACGESKSGRLQARIQDFERPYNNVCEYLNSALCLEVYVGHDSAYPQSEILYFY